VGQLDPAITVGAPEEREEHRQMRSQKLPAAFGNTFGWRAASSDCGSFVSAKFARLVALKNRYDPGMVFTSVCSARHFHNAPTRQPRVCGDRDRLDEKDQG
jgi:hypothetical protein